jgi:cation transport ATPase
MTKAKLHIAHQAPGRVRMKIPAGRGNPELLQQVADTFRQIPGIEEVSINPTTGSVVLRYDVDRHDEFHDDFRRHYDRHAEYTPPTTEIDTLARKIEDEAEFLAQNSASARAIVDFVKHVDHNIKSATNNNVDLKILFAGGIVAVTILEIGASAATPVWVTLSLFAVNHFIEMHPPHPKAAHASAPVVVKGS